MAETEKRFVVVQPGDEYLWESAEDCPFSLSELKPSEPMKPAELAVLKAQLQERE